MGKGFLFFAFSCCILVLSIINLSIGPVVNKVVSEIKIGSDEVAWGTANCARYKDLKDDEDDEDKKNKTLDETIVLFFNLVSNIFYFFYRSFSKSFEFRNLFKCFF